MSNPIEKYEAGHNCGQAILACYADKCGISKETSLKLGCSLGGGFRSGEICGAISAGCLILSLQHGNETLDDKDAKDLCYNKTIEFMKSIKEKNTNIACRDIKAGSVGNKQCCYDTMNNVNDILKEMGY